MKERTIKLLTLSGDLLATGQVVPEGALFAGSIDLSSMPEPIVRIFQEFEELVNGQVFSLLDDIEQRINELAIKVAFDDGSEAFVEDLQIYPSTGLASFAIRSVYHKSIGAELKSSLLTEAQRQEVDRRLAAHRANPQAAIPWEQVEAEALARLRR